MIKRDMEKYKAESGESSDDDDMILSKANKKVRKDNTDKKEKCKKS